MLSEPAPDGTVPRPPRALSPLLLSLAAASGPDAVEGGGALLLLLPLLPGCPRRLLIKQPLLFAPVALLLLPRLVLLLPLSLLPLLLLRILLLLLLLMLLLAMLAFAPGAAVPAAFDRVFRPARCGVEDVLPSFLVEVTDPANLSCVAATAGVAAVPCAASAIAWAGDRQTPTVRLRKRLLEGLPGVCGSAFVVFP